MAIRARLAPARRGCHRSRRRRGQHGGRVRRRGGCECELFFFFFFFASTTIASPLRPATRHSRLEGRKARGHHLSTSSRALEDAARAEEGRRAPTRVEMPAAGSGLGPRPDVMSREGGRVGTIVVGNNAPVGPLSVETRRKPREAIGDMGSHIWEAPCEARRSLSLSLARDADTARGCVASASRALQSCVLCHWLPRDRRSTTTARRWDRARLPPSPRLILESSELSAPISPLASPARACLRSSSWLMAHDSKRPRRRRFAFTHRP